MISVNTIDRQSAKEMIMEMKGGILTETDMLAVRACVSHASHTWICCADGKPVAAWGLVPSTFLSDSAYLWLHASPELDAHKFLFIRRSQRVMESMRKIYPEIYGVCEEHNHRAQRWIRWLGGVFGEPTSGYYPFRIETPHV